MLRNKIVLFAVFCFILLFSSIAYAHVPYIERFDYSEENPIFVWKMIEKSKAFYSWLENDGINPCKDLDVYGFTLKKPVVMYIEIIVPVVEDYYENFYPWYAPIWNLIG